jgi:hypothetical protein
MKVSIPLTFDLNVNKIILGYLTDQDLLKLASVSLHVKKQIELYIIDKINKEYNLNLNNFKNFKNINVLKLYKQILQFGFTSKLANQVAGNGYIDLLQWLMNKKIFPNTYGANLAAQNGHLTTVIFLEKNQINVSVEGANLTAGNNQLRTLKWLAKGGIFPTSSGANSAIKFNDFKILNWLKTKDILPSSKGADKAAKYGYLNILKWLKENDIMPSRKGVNQAAANGHMHILIWLEEQFHFYPDGNPGAIMAIKNNHPEIAKWLFEKGICPSGFALSYVIENNDIDSLSWLLKIGIREEYAGVIGVANINTAACQGNLAMLELFSQYNIFPRDFETIAYCGRLNILQWLVSKGIFPDKQTANGAASGGYINILEWILNLPKIYKNYIPVLPSKRGANNAATHGHLEMLEWLDKIGILPDREGATNAVINKHLNIVKLLAEKNILPNDNVIYSVFQKYHYDSDDLEMIKLLINLSNPIIPYQHILDQSLNYISLDILNYLARLPKPILPNSAYYAVSNGRLDILIWLSELPKPILPDESDIGQVIGYRKIHINVLKWAIERNIYPNQDTINKIAGYGNLELLQILETTGRLPNKDGANLAAEYDQLEVLTWLDERNITIDLEILGKIIENGHLNIIEWIFNIFNKKSMIDELNRYIIYNKYELFNIIIQHNRIDLAILFEKYCLFTLDDKVIFKHCTKIIKNDNIDMLLKYGSFKFSFTRNMTKSNNKNYSLDIMQKYINSAVKHGSTNVLKYLNNLSKIMFNKIILPYQKAVNKATEFGHTDTLICLSNLANPIILSQIEIDKVSAYYNTSLLIWASKLPKPLYQRKPN